MPNFEKLQIKAEETTALTNLAKQSNDLMKDVYNSFGNFKIENLRNKSKKTSSQTTNESKQNNISILMVKIFWINLFINKTKLNFEIFLSSKVKFQTLTVL